MTEDQRIEDVVTQLRIIYRDLLDPDTRVYPSQLATRLSVQATRLEAVVHNRKAAQ